MGRFQAPLLGAVLFGLTGPCRGEAMNLPVDAQSLTDPVNGTVVSLKANDLAQPMRGDGVFRRQVADGRWSEASIRLLAGYKAVFRLRDPEREWQADAVTSDPLAYTHVKLRQVFQGLPVWGGELIVHWKPGGVVYAINGHYFPTPSDLSTTPGIDARQALDAALTALGKAECAGCRPELGVFYADRVRPRLAYRVRLPASLTDTWLVTVEADSGSLLDKTTLRR